MGASQELAIIERFMRERGMRWTTQRTLIAEVALNSHAHFSADELLAMCQQRDADVSRATVYRTLSMLEAAGFVEGLDTGEGKRRFEHVLGHCHHDHMVCTACGEIIEFRDDALEKRQEVAAKEKGFQIESHSLKLFGRCRSCAKKKPQAEAGDGH
ncbi:MAG: Fur family transcriptional regulator [Planctomycetota bacterium]|jgi:Fur family ferric uptake transcriptional regulator